MNTSANQLKPEVMVYFGLRQQPFEPPKKLADIFVSKAIDALQEEIEDVLLRENRLVVISGESGVGSSVLAQYVRFASSPKLVFYSVVGNPSLSATDILLEICKDYEDKEVFLEGTREGKSLSKFASTQLFRLMREGMQPVIVVDQAHKVSVNLLNDIIRFCEAVNTRNKGLVKMMLVYTGRAEKYIEGLNGNWVRENNQAEFIAQPLKRNEARKYITHRFNNAGLSLKLPFTEQTTMLISDGCKNIPAAIDQTIVQSLNSRHLTKKPTEPEESQEDEKAPSNKWRAFLPYIIGATLSITVALVIYFSV